MTPTETDPKKLSQDERRFLPEVNMERAKRLKRSNVNSPKPRPTVRESRPRSFEEESPLDTGEEPMAKIFNVLHQQDGMKVKSFRVLFSCYHVHQL